MPGTQTLLSKDLVKEWNGWEGINYMLGVTLGLFDGLIHLIPTRAWLDW